jgi:peptide/nickel transport system ATP-binding protein
VFQDPGASLDPRMRVAAQVDEALWLSGVREASERASRTQQLFAEVGLGPELLERLPRELSGGQRQRVCIARALAAAPRGLVCDEAVSALDVSVRAQILNLLAALQERHGLALLLVSHDLAVVRHLARRVAVMYLGQIVEEAESDALFDAPEHPYTQRLLAAARDGAAISAAFDEPASIAAPPSGCRFHPRCPRAVPRCSREGPSLARHNARRVRCGVVAPTGWRAEA